MSVLHHLWGHAIMFAAYLINRTPSQGEKGSELESLRLELENHVFKDIALGKEVIGCTKEKDWSPRSGD
ncbi:unnamed protein product [Prunus armeniaca]